MGIGAGDTGRDAGWHCAEKAGVWRVDASRCMMSPSSLSACRRSAPESVAEGGKIMSCARCERGPTRWEGRPLFVCCNDPGERKLPETSPSASHLYRPASVFSRIGLPVMAQPPQNAED